MPAILWIECLACGHSKAVTRRMDDGAAPGKWRNRQVRWETEADRAALTRRLVCSVCGKRNVRLTWSKPSLQPPSGSRPPEQAGQATGPPPAAGADGVAPVWSSRLCVQCGRPIQLTRVQALPSTETCVDCARQAEKGRCLRCGAKLGWHRSPLCWRCRRRED